jgi:hypothetical protein
MAEAWKSARERCPRVGFEPIGRLAAVLACDWLPEPAPIDDAPAARSWSLGNAESESTSTSTSLVNAQLKRSLTLIHVLSYASLPI